MKTVTLGCAPFTVAQIGLGCMGMSEFYGPTDDELSSQVLNEAIDLGVDFFDTSDFYGQGHNEGLIKNVLKSRREQVRVATKFGIVRNSPGSYSRGLNNRPEYIREACEASLTRLGREIIDLYYIHRLDPSVEVEDSVGELGRLVAEGKIRAIGLCEVSAETLRRAHAVHPIAAVQSEYSLWTRIAEKEVLPAARQLGVAFVAYSPLGRGMLTGKITNVEALADGDFRANLPRFQGQNFDENMNLVATLQSLADDLQCTPGQVSLAWLLAQGDDVIPIPGTRRLNYLRENIAAGEVELSDEDLARISTALPNGAASGDRYTPEGMKGVEMV